MTFPRNRVLQKSTSHLVACLPNSMERQKIIPFYTNDLAFTPDQDVFDGDEEQAIKAVHCLAPLKRWSGTDVLQHSTVMVLAPIVAYNMLTIS